ncbi:MAG: recombinase family protein [Bacteroidetes bacterium]|nr:recombinase family protein [Bacteroidota bacterium]
MRTVIYARISTSTKGQSNDNQLEVLREYCKRMNIEVVGEYTDEVSGGTSDRPAFKKLFQDASKRKFDLVLFWSLDRWTREGTRATIKYFEQLESYGVAFKSYTELYIDSCGIFKDVVISLLSTLAKQEKIRISERVRAGLARSTKKGGRPQLQNDMIEKIKSLKKQGLSNRTIGKDLKISHSTVAIYV